MAEQKHSLPTVDERLRVVTGTPWDDRLAWLESEANERDDDLIRTLVENVRVLVNKVEYLERAEKDRSTQGADDG